MKTRVHLTFALLSIAKRHKRALPKAVGGLRKFQYGEHPGVGGVGVGYVSFSDVFWHYFFFFNRSIVVNLSVREPLDWE